MAIVVDTSASKVVISPAEAREKRRQARVLTQGGFVFVALCFGLLLRVLAFEGVLITSGSMESELRRGDYNLVDHRVALRGSWQRGDVVIFDNPPSWEGRESTLVKRVIGMPGEQISLYKGRVYINNRVLSEPYLQPGPLEFEEDVAPVVLGREEYFMLGDNRDNSDDSRDNGPVEAKYIRGRVLARLWPLSRFGRLVSPEYGVGN